MVVHTYVYVVYQNQKGQYQSDPLYNVTQWVGDFI